VWHEDLVVPRAFYAVHGGCKLHPNQARGEPTGGILEDNYTVVHKKTCHFIFDHNSHVSWWIFTLVVPMETGINFLPRVFFT